MYLKHESGSSAELRNQQVLGDDSPLVFDEEGYAEVDDARGEKLLTMHRHIEPGGHGPETGGADEFDAGTFVDRTPMSDVVEDIETGEYDDHLDAIADEASRQGVLDAVDARQE